jgi:hypothetical protein
MTHEQYSSAAAGCAGQRTYSPPAIRTLRLGDEVGQQARIEHHRARTKSTVEDFVMVTPPLVALAETVTV